MLSRAAIYRLVHRRGAAQESQLLAVLPDLICTAGLLAVIADTGIGARSRADLVLSGIVPKNTLRPEPDFFSVDYHPPLAELPSDPAGGVHVHIKVRPL